MNQFSSGIERWHRLQSVLLQNIRITAALKVDRRYTNARRLGRAFVRFTLLTRERAEVQRAVAQKTRNPKLLPDVFVISFPTIGCTGRAKLIKPGWHHHTRNFK